MQLAFSDAFGVIPSTESAAAVYAENYPENAARFRQMANNYRVLAALKAKAA